jgi:hypothetical protein
MRYVYGLALTAVLSILTGLPVGAFWRFAEAVAGRGIGWLVLVGIPGNLISAFAVYMSIRAGAAVSGSGRFYVIVLGLANLFIVMTLVFAASRGFGPGESSTMSTHAFTLGMAYAYYQAYRDVANDTWFDQ